MAANREPTVADWLADAQAAIAHIRKVARR
jgi:hypothetical protein